MSLVHRASELAATTALTLEQAIALLDYAEDANWTYDALYAVVVHVTEAESAPADIQTAVRAWQEGEPDEPITTEDFWSNRVWKDWEESMWTDFAALEEAGRRLSEQRRDELHWLARSLEADDAPKWLRRMVQERWMAGWHGR